MVTINPAPLFLMIAVAVLFLVFALLTERPIVVLGYITLATAFFMWLFASGVYAAHMRLEVLDKVGYADVRMDCNDLGICYRVAQRSDTFMLTLEGNRVCSVDKLDWVAYERGTYVQIWYSDLFGVCLAVE